MTKEEVKLEERRIELKRQREEAEHGAWCTEIDNALLDNDNAKVSKLLKRTADACAPSGSGCFDCKYGARSYRFANGKTACELCADVTEKKRTISFLKESLRSEEDVKARIEADIDEMKNVKLADLEAKLKECNAAIADFKRRIEATTAALCKVPISRK